MSNWDRRNNLDSRGAHVFREFWRNVDFTETTNDVFDVPFDESDPINTPRDLKITAGTRAALADAIAYFQNNGVALDTPLMPAKTTSVFRCMAAKDVKASLT